MKIIVLNKGENAKVEDVENSLTSLQNIIGGYLEVVRLSKELILVCDEEGRMKYHEANRLFYDNPEIFYNGDIFGNCFVCRTLNEDFIDVKDTDYEFIKKCAVNGIIKKL